MIRKITALLLVMLLMFSLLTVSAQRGEQMYEYIQQVADFIRDNGLYSSDEDEPVKKALIEMLEENPELFEALLTYMLNDYDNRTMHIPSSLLASQLQTSGYVGVGITLSFVDEDADCVIVNALHPEGGAKRAGIEVDDEIIAINGELISEMDFDNVAAELRNGAAGSFVSVTVRRGVQILELSVERTLLGEPEYSARELEKGVWLMRWTQFRTMELMEDFHKTIDEMARSGAQSLIIDLRGNGGGLLDMAFEIVESLIPEKGLHYLSIGWREGEEMVYQDLESPGVGIALNEIIILCDEGTASASEIIISALCDTGHAVAVGSRTYGKATAQYEITTLTGSVMIITAYKMKTVNGSDYDLTGLYPFYNVTNTEQELAPPELRLRETALSRGNCSDDAERLNLALCELGMMTMPETPYRLGESTQAAINNLRQKHGLNKIQGLDIETVRLINVELENIGVRTIVPDAQMEKALELAREGLKAEILYTVDENGFYINK